MANTVSLEIRTPTKSFYKGECELLIVTTVEGEEGFMAGHAWATKILDNGGLWIREPEKKTFRSAAIAGGFIDVKDEIVIFTDAAEWRKDIDADRARETLERAQAWLDSSEEHDEREVVLAKNTIKKAESRLKIADGGRRDK
jgi:F-type H+-transporting ATPase subunit epsilon